MHKPLCEHMFNCSDKYLGMECLGHMTDVCLAFYKIVKLFSIAIVQFYIPTSSEETPFLQYLCQYLVWLKLFCYFLSLVV